MKLLALLQTKALVAVVAGILLVGGATAAFAATPAGQTVVQSFTHAHPTATAAAIHRATPEARGTALHGQNSCPGLSDAQNLAASYHLNTASTSTTVKELCALHEGTFTSTTTAGVKVTVSRVYGYGEIDHLLAYAQYLAAKAGGKLSDTNVSNYLANALHSCGSTPLESCLKTNIPGFTPDSGHGNKPTTTPTPNGHKPTGTPTPHH